MVIEAKRSIISEYSKLAQKEYKSWHDKVDKVIYLELCKELKFDHTNKWYMHKLESVRKNETQNSTRILRYKRVTLSRPHDQN